MKYLAIAFMFYVLLRFSLAAFIKFTLLSGLGLTFFAIVLFLLVLTYMEDSEV